MISPLWWGMALLLILAVGFFVWPLRRTVSGSPPERMRREYLEANVQLFREHLAELEAARDAGRLTPTAFEQLKREQQRALLEEQRELVASKPLQGRVLPGGRVILIVAAVLMLMSVGLYHWQGSSEDLRLVELQTEKARLDRLDREQDRRPDPARTWTIVEHLTRYLKSQPESTEHLFLLAHYLREMGHYQQAADAYERILEQQPEAPRILAALAEIRFIDNDNRVSPQIRQLLQRALEENPRETTALGLAGIDAFNQEQFGAAIGYWRRALVELGQSPQAVAFERGIERARQALTEGGGGQADSEPDESGKSVSLEVEVSLGSDVPFKPGQTVFVYARAWQGSPMPLAIKRLNADSLPSTIVLDETMAMSPSASLASVNQVELVARLSQSGNAMAQAGDWQASRGPVSLDKAPETLTLVIDQRVEP